MPIHVIPGEISTFTVAIAIISGFILFFGYISMFLKERLFLSEALVAVIVGIIAGPLVTNGFNPYSWDHHDEITKQLTRCIIAIQVMAVGIDLPKHYLKKEWKTMLMLLMPVMIFMWLISGLFIWGLVPPINYLEALVISACICPTDPILANSVVKGRFAEKHVPAHIRNALSAESGANDGMGFPFLFLAIFLIAEDDIGTAIGKWIYITCLFQIVLSCIIGVVVGYVARKVLQWSERHHLIDKPSFLAFAIALALFLMSMTGFSGSDDLLACFVAGNAFSWDDWFRHETEEAHFQEVIDMMLNLAIFVYIGAIIPWSDFTNAELGLTPWRLVAIAILVLFFRRLPIVVLLKPVMPAMKTYREAIFSGWFGPMGVGAVFLSIIAKEELETAYEGKESPVSIRVISPVVLFIVFCSVIVHGTTIPLFKLGKRIRTRTLSITSISSNQVLRLPKLQFGQQLHKHHEHKEEGGGGGGGGGMTELERNTLFNTLQHDHIKEHGFAVDMSNKHSDSDSELAEEDFLPDDASVTSQPKLAPVQCDKDEDFRRVSAVSLDTQQAIRFLEPVKPRVVSEKNESGLKSWLTRPKEEEEEEHAHGIKSLFKRKKDHKGHAIEEEEVESSLENVFNDDTTHSRIQVWDEENHVVVEDIQGQTKPVVIDKSNYLNWKKKTKEKIKEVEHKINTGET
ncbi:Sodium/hydrogen exchanger family-domain-containing protein [Mucor mucedo]|uniref:Sodium/hydrogen exchanger family-domain-containing protein n=1 Tax=Mucor mucedo TaxID=29922 RepID=UPI002220B419|nr:Sodium/hydrogen exchanger family-domain-containing protein [Mucor mucedo]KAI7886866.1 Sodium/hydrogen exchanger family-domain-containing protein [Mucor mucedo]